MQQQFPRVAVPVSMPERPGVKMKRVAFSGGYRRVGRRIPLHGHQWSAHAAGARGQGISYETSSIASNPGITVALTIPIPDFSQYSASYPCRSEESSTIL